MLDKDFIETEWNEFLEHTNDGLLVRKSANGNGMHLTAAKLAFVAGFGRGSKTAFELSSKLAKEIANAK